MAYKNLSVEIQDGIMTMYLDDGKLNTLSWDMAMDIAAAVEQAEADDSVRVVIITSKTRAFVAGAELSTMKDVPAEEIRDYLAVMCKGFRAIPKSKKVYIAAINGFIFGGGMELALACDIRIASEKAVFGSPEVSLGIYPCAGATQRLPRLIGQQNAMLLLLTGDSYTAAEALEYGVVAKVTPHDELLDEAKKIAKRILKNSPLAVRYAKECIRKADELPMEEGLVFENAIFPLTYANPDQMEGMNAFLEKRKPNFKKTL